MKWDRKPQTRELLKTMNPEKQRIAIAEACGWTDFEWAGGLVLFGTLTIGDKYWEHKVVPEYTTNLDAIHGAEKMLNKFQREAYASVLGQVVTHIDGEVFCVPQNEQYIGWIEHPADTTFQIYHATAAQRAEAMLRTLGKWEDDK